MPIRFVDLTDAYSPRLRALARSVDPTLAEGVYAGLPGPHFETPAEIRMLRLLGADLVGMSTVWETIAARHLGLEVLALSLVTNLAAGLSGEPLNHDEVLEAGRVAAERMGTLLADVVGRHVMAAGADLVAAARAWRDEDPDPATRAEIDRLLGGDGHGPDLDALADRFGARLQFGTAGLRGEMGAGPNRMNRAVVIRATAGLAAHLAATGHAGEPVIVGYDARHLSDRFARDAAAVLAAAGFPVHLADRPLPTPVVAFGVTHLGCCAGVQVTASHNPPRDNGYKVYLGDGAQIVPPSDAEISAQIDAVGPLASVPRAADDDPRITPAGDALVDAYVAGALAQAVAPEARELGIVYTPLHGVGRDILVEVLTGAGFGPPTVVAEQGAPDPDFPTVAFPNPEEPGALDLALEAAARSGADVVIANDPDADRLAVALPAAGGPSGAWSPLDRRRDRRRAGRLAAGPRRGGRPAGGHVGRVVVDARPAGRGSRRRLRRDADRVQVAGPGGAGPPRSPLRVRLRGGARVVRRHARARQGRHHRGPRLRRAGGQRALGRAHGARPPRRPGPRARGARDRGSGPCGSRGPTAWRAWWRPWTPWPRRRRR